MSQLLNKEKSPLKGVKERGQTNEPTLTKPQQNAGTRHLVQQGGNLQRMRKPTAHHLTGARWPACFVVIVINA